MDEIVFKVKASPFFWREKASELKFASETIWPVAIRRLDEINNAVVTKKEIVFENLAPDTFDTFMALMGFSIECLFKAVIIRVNPEYVTGGKISKKLKNHNLIELAKLAKIVLTQNERIFCKQAYRNMLEYRYPVPSAIEPPNSVHEIGGHCKDVFTELYNKIYPTVGQIGRWKKS